MTEYRDILERQLELLAPPRIPIDRLTRRRDRQRRNQRITAGIVAAVVSVLAITGLIRAFSPPPGTGHRPTPTPVPSVDQRELTRLPAEGAHPSEPAVGELVVSFSAEDVGNRDNEITSISVYADGRVVWHRASCGLTSSRCSSLVSPQGENEPNTGWLEQRLTVEGVELLRSELLSTGLFEEDATLDSSHADLVDYLTFGVRNRGSLVTVGLQPAVIGWPEAPKEAQVPALEHAQEILLDLNAWLPADAWSDRTIHAFIPSHYTMWFYPRFPSDPSDLPSPADQLFNGTDSTVLTTDQARDIAAGFEAAGVSAIRGRVWDSVAFPVTISGRKATMFLEPNLPG